ncbi:MAG: toll/interleukin-1 receptor domain-containing protein [Lactococcus lactis]
MDLFKKQDSYTYFESLKSRISEEISSMSNESILDNEIEEWSEYYAKKYEVEPIILFEDNISISTSQTKVKTYNHFYHMRNDFDDEPEFFYVDGYKITFTIPFDGNPNLFQIQPSSFYMQHFLVSDVKNPQDEKLGTIIFDLTFKNNELDLNSQYLKDNIMLKFTQEFKNYKEMIERVSNDAKVYNSGLKVFAHNHLNARKNNASQFRSLSSLIDTPSTNVGLTKSKKSIPELPKKVKREVQSFDVFISYAHEDSEYVKELESSLKNYGIKVWIDKDQMTWGARISQKINEGLISSKFGIIILSSRYLEKYWTKNELDSFFALEASDGKQRILPIWHKITHEEIVNKNPLMAGVLAKNSESETVEEIVSSLQSLIRQEDK